MCSLYTGPGARTLEGAGAYKKAWSCLGWRTDFVQDSHGTDLSEDKAGKFRWTWYPLTLPH